MIASFLYLCLYAWHLVLPGYLIARLLAIRRGTFLLAVAFSYSLLLLNLLPMEWLKAPLWIFTLAFNLQIALLLAANFFMGYRRGGGWQSFWSKSGSCMHPRTADEAPAIVEATPSSLQSRLSSIGGSRSGSGKSGGGAASTMAHRRWKENLHRSAGPSLWSLLNRCWPPLLIVAGVFVYLTWAGPYMELLADPWTHVGRFLSARQVSVEPGHFDQFWLLVRHNALFDYVTQQGGHWYILQALLCRWSGLAIPDLPGPLTMANTIVFCLAVYGFALCLWSGQRIHRHQKIQVALWSMVFTVLWLGINVFAYIRYYALAPAILNYVMYLAAVILILDYFRSRSWWGHALWLVPLLVMAMNVIHTQEAMFACFMGLGLLVVMEGQGLWEGWRRRREEIRGQRSEVRGLPDEAIRAKSGQRSVSRDQGSEVRGSEGRLSYARALPPTRNRFDGTGRMADGGLPAGNMLKIHILFVGGLIIFGLLLYCSFHKPMAGYSEFLLRPLFHGEWLGQKWFIQPLTGQFAQVVTWWGVFVYALFLLHIRCFKRQPFILAGMLMPCLIVFNPLTIVILSRWIPDLSAIYRFNYMIPLPFVAGFLAMRFLDIFLPAKYAKGRENINNSADVGVIAKQRKSLALYDMLFRNISSFSVFSRVSRAIIVLMPCWRRLWASGCLLGLLILLTPVETLIGRLSNSRFYTLKPVAEGNDQRRWGDLIALVRKHPQVNVLTDSYTFVLLLRMDVKVIEGIWWVTPAAPGADRLALLRRLDRKQDWWLVVNRRNGDFSMNGARSGHWCGDALTHFATVYSEDMLLFVKEHPELFKEIWSKDQVQVYDIVESRIWE